MPEHICVYFLQNEGNSYIGFTVNLQRRLRQHKGELKGGARCTSRWKLSKQTRLVAIVSNFPNKNRALSYEWHAKQRREPCVCQDPYKRCHSRLPRFLQPLLLAKFQDLKPVLKVYLISDHHLRKLFMERFQLTYCEVIADDVT